MRTSFITFLFCFACFAGLAQDFRAIADTCYHQGDYECARENYGKHLINVPADSVVTALKDKADECALYRRDADDNYKKKKIQEAMYSYDEILKINPLDRHASSRFDSCVIYLKPKPPSSVPVNKSARADLPSERPDTATASARTDLQSVRSPDKSVTTTTRQPPPVAPSKKTPTFASKHKNYHDFIIEREIFTGFCSGYTRLFDKASNDLYEGMQVGWRVEHVLFVGLKFREKRM